MIIVVGCGVAGLSCAVLLAEAGHRVEIWTKTRPPLTTSNVAAAFWYPYQAFPRERVVQWARLSHRRFRALAQDPQTGVRLRRLVDLYRKPQPSPWWAELVGGHEVVPAAELPPGFATGFAFESPVIDTRHYLPYLIERLHAAGGRIVDRHLQDLGEALAVAPTVVCCAGLGARELAHDGEMYPIRGQLVHVDNPGIDRIVLDEYSDDGLAYVVPRGDHCVLGGTADPHCDDRSTHPDETVGIRERCARLDPRLRDARVRAEVVGLRPGRPTIRLDAERRGAGTIIYNYGHGGAGVTLSWGCATEAVALAEAAHQPAAPRPSPATR